jgi:hypothetical protein
MTEYISLGSDCSIAFNLDKHNLRINAYPFDWIKINNINDLINILSNDFKFFTDMNYIEILNESDKFPYLDDKWTSVLSKNVILKNTKYNITFPHEIKIDDQTSVDIKIKNFIDKYDRRINKFISILKNDSIKKVFIRITNKKEELENLNDILSKICLNYELKIIIINKKNKFLSWKKEELNWENIFIQENHNLIKYL